MTFDETKLVVSGKLQPLGIAEIPETKVEALLDSLRSRLKAWQEQVKQKTDIEKQMAAIDSEMKRLDAVIDTQVKALAEKQETLERLKKELADGTEERKQLYGDKKPDDEDGRLNEAIDDAEKAEKKARDLNTDLTPAGFADEKAFLEARLSQEDRESLSARAKELDDAGTELKAKQKDRETRLATEIGKKLTDKTLEELLPQFKEFEESLKELRDAVAGLTHKLSENTAAKERIEEKRSAIEAQKKECHRWEKLHVVDNYQAGEIRSTKNLSGPGCTKVVKNE